MRAGGGKAKGAAFERLVCERLSLWQSSGKRDDLFWRSAMSGGRASVKFQKGKKNQSQIGDISAIDQDGHWLVSLFVIECKFVKSAEFDSWINSNGGMAYGFWAKLVAQAEAADRYPMLVIKQNRVVPMVLMTESAAEVLGLGQCEHTLAGWRSTQAHIYLFETLVTSKCRRS